MYPPHQKKNCYGCFTVKMGFLIGDIFISLAHTVESHHNIIVMPQFSSHFYAGNKDFKHADSGGAPEDSSNHHV